MARAFAIHELGLFYKRFVSDAIQTFVGFFINITLRETPTPQFLSRRLVVRIGGTDEMYIGIEIKRFFQSLKALRILVRVRLRVFPLFLCLAVNLESVLIGPGIEEYFVATKFSIPHNNICLNEFERKTDMRVGVYVRKCSCEVKKFTIHDKRYSL